MRTPNFELSKFLFFFLIVSSSSLSLPSISLLRRDKRNKERSGDGAARGGFGVYYSLCGS